MVVGFEYLNSLDTYSGYYWIPMNSEDEEKTTFVIDV